MRKEHEIPFDNNDVAAAIARKFYIKLFLFFLCAAVSSVFFLFYGIDYFSKYFGAGSAWGLFVFFLIIPFFALGLYRIIFDKSWEGEVERVDSQTMSDISDAVNRVGYKIQLKIVFIVSIKLNNGDYTEKIFKCQRAPCYKGDIVKHFRGTSYLHIISKENDTVICIMCGSMNKLESLDCVFCGYSLIK